MSKDLQFARKSLSDSVGYEGLVRALVLCCYVTNFAPHKTLNFIAWCKLTFDERVLLYLVDGPIPEGISGC